MPQRTLIALLASLLLVLAACGDNGAEPQADDEDAEAQGEEDAAEEELAAEPEPVELEDGVAGTVEDDEISDGEVAEATEELAGNPQIEAQIEQGQLTEELLPTVALEQAIQTQVLERGADDLGVEVGEAELEAAEEELVEDMGGPDEFDDQLDEAGLNEEDLEETLRLEALINGVQEQLDVDEAAAEDEEAPMGPDGQPVDPAEAAFQEWFYEQMVGTDIAVDEEYGVWVAEQGTIMPPEDLLPEQPEQPEMSPEDLEDMEDMDPEELEELMEQMNG